uniref:(northern house mosquito) hypothetical protein n=1 Tax=Culex pipiens TaxID=7175 RepID=A0A8D8NPC3_CULPI
MTTSSTKFVLASSSRQLAAIPPKTFSDLDQTVVTPRPRSPTTAICSWTTTDHRRTIGTKSTNASRSRRRRFQRKFPPSLARCARRGKLRKCAKSPRSTG